MKIEINAEQVDQLVRDTILKAGIGKTIEKSVERVLAPNSYNNPIDDELRKYLGTVVKGLLETEFSASLTAAVTAAMRAKLTSDIMERVADEAIEKIMRAFRDRD